MTPNLSRGLAAAALAALVASAGLAAAQPAPPDRAPAMERPDPAAMSARRAERLRDVLQLRPDQEGALRAFVDQMGPRGDMRRRFDEDRQEMQRLTTPQRLERMRTRMAERQARFDQRAQATLRFYSQLSPAQQRAFDAMAPMGGRRGGGFHGGRRGHGMMKDGRDG